MQLTKGRWAVSRANEIFRGKPDESSLSSPPKKRRTGVRGMTLAETHPYSVEAGITPFRTISILPTSPTGTSTAAFRIGSHSA